VDFVINPKISGRSTISPLKIYHNGESNVLKIIHLTTYALPLSISLPLLEAVPLPELFPSPAFRFSFPSLSPRSPLFLPDYVL